MPMVRRAHYHRIDIVARQQITKIVVGRVAVQFQCLACLLTAPGVNIADSYYLAAGLAVETLHIPPAHVADADTEDGTMIGNAKAAPAATAEPFKNSLRLTVVTFLVLLLLIRSSLRNLPEFIFSNRGPLFSNCETQACHHDRRNRYIPSRV